MKFSRRSIAAALLTVGLYASGWFFENFDFYQYLAICLVLLPAALVACWGFGRGGLTLTEIILLAAVVGATAVAIAEGRMVNVAYGLLLLTVLIAVGIVVRFLLAEHVFVAAFWSYLLLVLSVLALQGAEFLETLSVSRNNEVGLVRLYPLGLHPNLSGFLYGGGAVVMVRAAAIYRGGRRILAIIGFMFCIAIMLAASARAGLLALAAALGAGAMLVSSRLGKKTKAALVFGSLVLLLALILNAEQIGQYLVSILEIDSETRGVGSGGSGRLELWERGYGLATEDVLHLFVGRGFRSGAFEAVGFHFESSYLTIAYEFGVLFTVVFVMRSVWLTVRTARTLGDGRDPGWFIMMVLIFVMVQSIFNRYLIAVGNTLSLLFIFLLLLAEFRVREIGRDRRIS